MNKRVTPSKRQRENEHHFNDVINVSTSPKMYFACLFFFLVILRKHIAHGHSLKGFTVLGSEKKKYWTVLGYLNAARSSRTDRLLLYFNSSSSSSAHSTGPHGTMSDSRSGLVYLITGGCGFLGRHLLRVLLDQEEDALAEVRIFDKHTELGLSELGTGRTKVTVIQGDITDYDSVLVASQGAHVVIHTASLVDVWHKVPEALIYAVNVTGTENVIKACVNNNVCCLLYTSSMEVIGPNMNREPFVRGNEDTPYEVKHTMAYPKSKAKAEKIVLEANGTKVRNGERLRTCSLRPTGIYGEGHELIKDFYKLAVKRGGLIIGGVPDTTEHGRVYVGNVAWMHVLAARALRERPETVGGEAFFCYDDSPYKSYEDFNMLFLSTFKFRRVRMPMQLLWFLAMLNDMLRWILTPFCNFAPLLNSYTLAVAITSFTVSTDKALRHFQYRPLYNWDQCRERTQGWVDTFPLEDPKNT